VTPARLAATAALVLLLGGCQSSSPGGPVRAVDLLREMDSADRRPAGAFALTGYRLDGVSRPAISATVPSRLTVRLPLPRHGVFHAFVALADGPDGRPPAGARLRVGISDDRTYEGLTEVVLAPGTRGWVELRANLSAYAGWKWSLFYRPDRIVWRLVLAADAVEHGPASVLWAEPRIDTDTQSAREYLARRQGMR
jgi:hypothetical protein